MRLLDLDPIFLRTLNEKTWTRAADMRTADGVQFFCPKCYFEKGRVKLGVHQVLCWTPKVPQTIRPTPGRWSIKGTSLSNISLVGEGRSSSVLLTTGCKAHFYVSNGYVINCDQPKWDT